MASFGVSPWATADWGNPALELPESGYSSQYTVPGGEISPSGVAALSGNVMGRPAPRGRSPVSDMLGRGGNIRNAIAEAQLKLLRNQLNAARERQTRERNEYDQYNDPRMVAARMNMERARSRMAGAQADRFADENMNRRLAIGMESEGRTGNLDFDRYKQLLARKMYTGGPTGRVGFQGVPLNRLGSGAQPSVAQQMAMARMAQAGAPRFNRYGYGTGMPVEGPSAGSIDLAPYQQTGGQDLPRQLGIRNTGSRGARLPGYAKGTLPGTVQGDQVAEIHDGEVIVSADQVDEPLLRYLIKDKAKKRKRGQVKGEMVAPGDTRDSYQVGTLPEEFDPSMLPGYQPGPTMFPSEPVPMEGFFPYSPDNLSEIYDFWTGGGRFEDTPLAERIGAGVGIGAREAGEMARGAGEVAGEVGSQFMQGFRGDDGAESSVSPPPIESPSGLPAPYMAPDPGTYESALEQLRMGEGLGEGAAPLRLQGEPDPLGTREKQIAEQTSKLNAQSNRAKADRLYKYLNDNIDSMTNEEYQMTMTRAKRFDQLADIADKRADVREERREAVTESSRGHERQMEQIGARMQAEGRLRFMQEEFKSLNRRLLEAQKAIQGDDPNGRRAGVQQAASIFYDIARMKGTPMTYEQALRQAQGLRVIDEDVLRDAISSELGPHVSVQ